jgi:hypothetical protein
MKHFKNGSLSEWQQVKAGDVISFESNKAKRVSFQVNANSKIEVWAADNEKNGKRSVARRSGRQSDH